MYLRLYLYLRTLPSQKLNSLLVQLNDARTMGSYPHLRKELPDTLTNIPIASVRRFSRHCFRFMDGYRNNLHGPILDFTMKEFKGQQLRKN